MVYDMLLFKCFHMIRGQFVYGMYTCMQESLEANGQAQTYLQTKSRKQYPLLAWGLITIATCDMWSFRDMAKNICRCNIYNVKHAHTVV